MFLKSISKVFKLTFNKYKLNRIWNNVTAYAVPSEPKLYVANAIVRTKTTAAIKDNMACFLKASCQSNATAQTVAATLKPIPIDKI